MLLVSKSLLGSWICLASPIPEADDALKAVPCTKYLTISNTKHRYEMSRPSSYKSTELAQMISRNRSLLYLSHRSHGVNRNGCCGGGRCYGNHRQAAPPWWIFSSVAIGCCFIHLPPAAARLTQRLLDLLPVTFWPRSPSPTLTYMYMRGHVPAVDDDVRVVVVVVVVFVFVVLVGSVAVRWRHRSVTWPWVDHVTGGGAVMAPTCVRHGVDVHDQKPSYFRSRGWRDSVRAGVKVDVKVIFIPISVTRCVVVAVVRWPKVLMGVVLLRMFCGADGGTSGRWRVVRRLVARGPYARPVARCAAATSCLPISQLKWPVKNQVLYTKWLVI